MASSPMVRQGKLVAGGALALATYNILGQNGFADGTANIRGLDIDGQWVQIFWTILSAVLPQVLGMFPAWVQTILKAVLDFVKLKAVMSIRRTAHKASDRATCDSCDNIIQSLLQQRTEAPHEASD